MKPEARAAAAVASLFALVMLVGFGLAGGELGVVQADESRDGDGHRKGLSKNDRQIDNHAQRLLEEGRQIFRFDTYGSEAFFGDALQLHRAIAGAQNGGVGPGVSPKTALAVGLKVDADALPNRLKAQIRAGKVNLDDPATTLALLRLNAVLGLTGRFDDAGRITSLGTQCALCHSNVDDSFAPGIGKRLDGWANRDLNVGVIVSLAPNLTPFTDLLGVDEATVRKVLTSWGPGCYDAWLDKDGKAFAPGGGRACTLIPPAFGLAGVNLHTWTGSGSVPYWNAYVAVTQQHGSGVFFDARLGNADQYPVSAKSGSFNTRGTPDLVTSKLAALHFYQLAIPAPTPPKGSFDKAAAARGEEVFNGRGQCATCHVPPLFTEPGHNLHTPAEMGIDSFQADRSPTRMYRTAPLAGLWTHQKGGFFHDGRFATLPAVIEHYDRTFRLGLTDSEKGELVEYLKSL
jgi:mono/diheme cytochrome c family protein